MNAMNETNNFTAQDERMLLDAIDNWIEKSVRPIAKVHDHEDKYPHALVEEMKELGLFGATISQQFGGLGLPASTYAKIVTRVSAVWMAPTGIFNSHLIMAAAIERAGTPQQKEKYLPRMASGELRGGLALTEPDCGTDLQAIRTTAKRDGDSYVINGNKIWITNSLHGGAVLLLVKTNPAAEPRHKGMSMFIAEKGPGFVVSNKEARLQSDR
jgi:alkylation response protein AidB-like acyl-CoA dehydrogenase